VGNQGRYLTTKGGREGKLVEAPSGWLTGGILN